MRDRGLTPQRRATKLALAGAASLTAGQLWHRSLPINKNLWTSSYVLASGGWSLLSLAALYWLYDIHQIQTGSRIARLLTKPANILGANALVAYALSIAGHKSLRYPHVQHEGHRLSLRTYAYRKVFARQHSTPVRSLAFAVTYAALIFIPSLLLWRKKIFVKI